MPTDTLSKEVTDRGFRIFGKISDRLGGTLVIQESSLAFEGAHVWLFYQNSSSTYEGTDPQLSVEQAKRLIEFLQVFVAEAEAGLLTEPVGQP